MERLRFRGFGEILYEVMTGPLFYPRALWRVLLRPAEVSEPGEETSAELVSPPLFLLLSILAAHGLDLAMRSGRDGSSGSPDLALLSFRVLAFSLLPLVMAAGVLGRGGARVDPVTLRAPFDLQCLYVAPFAISASVAAVLIRAPATPVRIAGCALAVAAVAWHLCVQTRWIRARLGVGRFRAARTALWLTTVAAALCALSALLIFGLPV